jgi:hypothetical protein
MSTNAAVVRIEDYLAEQKHKGGDDGGSRRLFVMLTAVGLEFMKRTSPAVAVSLSDTYAHLLKVAGTVDDVRALSEAQETVASGIDEMYRKRRESGDSPEA